MLLDLRYYVFLRFLGTEAFSHMLLRREDLLLRERGLGCKDWVRQMRNRTLVLHQLRLVSNTDNLLFGLRNRALDFFGTA